MSWPDGGARAYVIGPSYGARERASGVSMSNAAASLARIREELNHNFQERAELIDGALCALLSGSHVLIIGPPGTAKSMLSDELCRRIDGAGYFQWLLTKFTT
ncbi:MAG: AAA family ATPase, partial [Candidatus Dormibacteria bacterium]